MREGRLSGLLLATLTLAGCTKAREVPPRRLCYDFEREVAPAIEAACLECHRPGSDESDYHLDTLANLYARDPESGSSRLTGGVDAPLLVAARGDADHEPVSRDVEALLTAWVVTCQAGTVRSEGVHGRGWVHPASDAFHGRVLRQDQWDLRTCVSCHGQPDERGGGASGVSCLRCHQESPTGNCTTCHGDETFFSVDENELSTRVHRAHLQPGVTLGIEVDCEECHRVPTDWREPGHVWGERRRESDPTPSVVLGGLAAADVPGLESQRLGAPAFTGGGCVNVYCHGHTLDDPNYTIVAWQEPGGESNCELCHGMPPTETHGQELELSDCEICHGLVVDGEGNIIDASLHLDGELTIGDRTDCSACHGSASSPAPPPALDGNTDPMSPGVGAHLEHVEASTIAPALPCSACHLEPTGDTYTAALAAEGHMDTALPAEVFADPAGLAFADGAQPTYDAQTATCSNVYCHGGGERLLQDRSAGTVRTLSWTDDAGSVFCGRCHGIAPDTPTHVNVTERTTCYFCHPDTVGWDGEILIAPDGTSAHINGMVDP